MNVYKIKGVENEVYLFSISLKVVDVHFNVIISVDVHPVLDPTPNGSLLVV